MAQKTNLNINPYYDDFDSENNFYKVLYKPGYPVQARELTTSQSLLQNQIETFGSNIFKDGSIVVPGGVAYDNQYNSVKLKSSNFGIDISSYIKNYIGKTITGQTSGVSAKIKFVLLPEDDSRVDDVTIYVTYIANGTDFNQNVFLDNEEIISTENVTYGNTTINAGEVFASLVSNNATSVGSAADVIKGVYYIRGYFVDVTTQRIILDPYTNNSSYRVGLKVDENIISAKDDESLYDNAKGFSNFAAPGADRLQIKLTLIKKELTDTDDTDFVELMRIDKGQIKKISVRSDYNKIRDYIAERTFDESGSYSVTPFSVSAHNSLNNGLGNGGLYYRQELTEQQNTPSDDLMSIRISDGTAYVRGYDVIKKGTTVLDIEKPREVGIRSDVSLGYEMGNILRVNNVKGIPTQGSVIQLFDNFNATGDIIGSARVYSFNLEDSSYKDATSIWDLRLFDIQTYTSVGLNTESSDTDIREGSYIKGKNSGASGYAVGAGGNSTIISLTQTSGTFAKGEQIEIDGVDTPVRTVGFTTVYNTQNIKSVTQSGICTADSVLDTFSIPNGIREVTIDSSNTVRSSGKAFTGLRKGSVVRYQRVGFNTETYNKVASISADGLEMTLEAITDSVPGVYDGNVPGADIAVSMFAGAPIVRGSGQLFVPLANKNISSIDLTNSEFKIVENIDNKDVTTNSIVITTGDSELSDLSNFTFESFDVEKYSVALSTGNLDISSLSSDTFVRNSDGTSITISNLTNGESTISLALSKKGIVSKIKEYSRSRILNVNLSRLETSGTSGGNENNSIQNGLTYDSLHRYGLRVEDEEISLNYPDAVKIIGIFESLDTSAPVLEKLSFSSTVNIQNNAIVGENIISQNGKIVARVVRKPSGAENSDSLEVVYFTNNKFDVFDVVTFEESDITTQIQTITSGKYKDLTNAYILDKGQKDQYYDYSRIIRRSSASAPTKQLLIIFDHYIVPSGDSGDAFTVLSYDEDRFGIDIPSIGKLLTRASDTIDFRPRVPAYDVGTGTVSPFHYTSRTFNSSISKFLVPEESLRVGYEFYLPRIDKLLLNKFGEFVYKKGISSISPKSPISENDDLMEIATINIPAYLYNTQSISINQKDNRRYTMRDIGKIDSRLTNLEEVTSLSLLELDAKSIQVRENDMDRFKTGFFVDPFNNYNFINTNESSIEVNPDQNEITPFITRNTVDLQLLPSSNLTPENIDYNTNFDLFDSNVKKTGDAVTLNYDEVEWITQTKATEIENVNPFEQPARSGSVVLSPEVDFWSRTEQFSNAETIHVTGSNSTENINLRLRLGRQNLNLGTIQTRTEDTRNQTLTGGGSRTRVDVETTTTTNDFSDTIRLRDRDNDSVTISNTDTWFRNQLISSGDEEFMRSRNTQFKGSGFTSFTPVYAILDSQRPIIVPKLLEITTERDGSVQGSVGSFEVGEEVIAYSAVGNREIGKFRICTPDHKDGAFNSPSETYFSDPYSHGDIDLPSRYSSSTTCLNLDTRAICEQAQGRYFGYVQRNSLLVGQTSGARSYVKGDPRLITDTFGDVIGTFFIENPYSFPTPDIRITTGPKDFVLTTSETNRKPLPGADFSVIRAEASYVTGGTLDQWQEQNFSRTDTTTINARASVRGRVTATVSTENQHTQTTVTEYVDPVAQTFTVGGNVESPSAVNQNNDLNGAFITAVEVFFATIDTEHPVKCQIRTLTGDDRPSRFALAEKELRPRIVRDGVIVDNILTSTDASVGTKFVFDEPVYLAPGGSYAIVLIAEKSINYTVWLASQGDRVVNVEPGADEQAQYTTQYALGSFFRSQNGGLWTENQRQDLTFKLYKAKFTSLNGSVLMTNPELNESNGYVRTLSDNPLTTLPKTGEIGIRTTTDATLVGILTAGRKITGENSIATAIITGAGGTTTSVNVTDGGINYTTNSSVDTFAIVGNGSGLKLNISSVNGGSITGISLASGNDGGTGYRVGDVVGIVTSTTSDSKGRGARITISTINGIDKLFLTNIQGEDDFTTTALKYYNDSGVVTTSNDGTDVNVTSKSFSSNFNSGNYIKVNHFNHGMYSSTNKVKLYNVEPNTLPTTITVNMTDTTTSLVGVADTTVFAKFEGIAVSDSDPGYAIIENEIIKYTDVTTDSITVAERGLEETIALPHNSGASIRKYELSGISLRRINNVNLSLHPDIQDDGYYVLIDRTANGNGIDRSSDVDPKNQISFTSEDFAGGSNVRATENILYTAVIPNYDVLTPVGVDGGTDISASIRTVTGTSVDGNESSFVDNGYQDVQINAYNALDSARIVSSKVNEDMYLSNLPRNKSFTTNLILSSETEDLSPIIYLNGSTEFISNRLNNPIGAEEYSSDSRIRSLRGEDPHSSVYVSQIVRLRQPSTALKVFLGAYRHESSDIRVLYRLFREDSSGTSQSYDLFPGYKNLVKDGNNNLIVQDESKNDGRPDFFVPPNSVGQYSEYRFTANNLDSFVGYSIKIILSGTNQAYYPRIKDLRTIALA